MKSLSEKKAREDRHSRRTKHLLQHALVQLILEKRYDSITVQNILDRADIGRSTFYAHFTDKEDLLLSSYQHLFCWLQKQLEEDETNRIAPSLALFLHIQSHHKLYLALVRSRKIDLFYKQGQKFLCDIIEKRIVSHSSRKPSIPIPILSDHLAGSLINLLKWWLENNMPYTAEKMDEIYHRLVVSSVVNGDNLKGD
jgi:AcrR family transcriptional regulator